MNIAIQMTQPDCSTFLTMPSGAEFDNGSSREIDSRIEKVISLRWGLESVTFGHPFYQISSSLSEVYRECSKAEWDGYEASPISLDAFVEANKLVRLLPSSIPMPEVVPEPSGEIGFEWRGKKGQIFVMSVSGRKKINYAGLFGSNKVCGTEYFDETLPEVIIRLIRRLRS